jgi:hypothetical protein
MNFNPNLTPREIIEAGSFGGSYFGFPIEEYIDYDYTSLFNYHFDGVDTFLYMGETYKPKLNRYKVRSGMDYQYWKDMGSGKESKVLDREIKQPVLDEIKRRKLKRKSTGRQRSIHNVDL